MLFDQSLLTSYTYVCLFFKLSAQYDGCVDPSYLESGNPLKGAKTPTYTYVFVFFKSHSIQFYSNDFIFSVRILINQL